MKKDENSVEIYKSGNVILAYKDKPINTNTFDRTIGSNKFLKLNEGDGYKQQLFTVKNQLDLLRH